MFIFVTIDPDNVPHIIQPHCQKYLFNKIKDGVIVEINFGVSYCTIMKLEVPL
jgi:DNA polymerase III gamma/tau subunit